MWRHTSTSEHLNLNYIQNNCIFCRSAMFIEPICNRWSIDEQFLRKAHMTAMDDLACNVDEVYVERRLIVSGFDIQDVSFHCCPACGWWCVIQMLYYEAPKSPFTAYQWAAGALVQEEFPDISAPITEVRSYLCARYDQRFSIDPYRLEEVVGSIFKSSGCHVRLTSRTHDGGLDIFGLDQLDRPFGIQVKRYRKRIGVEQLRHFVGALILHGQAQGVFVTTSHFSKNISQLCRRAEIAGIKLDCADGDKLFEMIKVAQISDFDPGNLRALTTSYTERVNRLNYGFPMMMNSL